METYSVEQEVEYFKSGTWSFDAYFDLSLRLIESMKLNESRQIIVARPLSFKYMFNQTRHKTETKNRYILENVPAKITGNGCPKVVVIRIK
jgi:hypothetical protein